MHIKNSSKIYSILLLVWVIVFPLNAKFLKELKKPASQDNSTANSLPLVYNDNYNIGFFGLEKLHPFDSKKYGKIYKHLVNTVGIDKNRFTTARMATDKELLLVHTPAYLESLKSSSVVARIAENPVLAYLPNFLLQRNLLNPMKYATGGTIQGAELALTHGWAINLAGGYHHAKGCGRDHAKENHGVSDEGGGFCFFADIPLAIHTVWEKKPNLKVLIVDLDAHQGNGHEAFFKKQENRVAIFDIYNKDIYPHDYKARQYIDFNFPVASGIDDAQYLGLLKRQLPNALEKFKPDFIIYNAGSDPLAGDPLGNMNISANGIIDRDSFVMEQARVNNIPSLMLLSGGYAQHSAAVISQSIESILKTVKS